MQLQQPSIEFGLRPIGFIRSSLVDLKDCPCQESENAPEAFLELSESYLDGIKDFAVGDKLVVLTWLHLADRSVLKCHKQNLVGTKEFGVFSTRSPDRPNPIGLHMVTIMEVVDERKIKIFPMEALDGTPVIDIKPQI